MHTSEPNVISVSVTDNSTALSLPSPHHVDDVRYEARRPRSDALIASTATSASSELVVADGELAPDLASTTRTTFPTPTTPTHSPFPHRPRRRRGHYPRSTLAVTRGRNFVDVEIISRSFRRPPSLAATQAFCSRSTTGTRLKRRAAALVGASSRESAECAVKTTSRSSPSPPRRPFALRATLKPRRSRSTRRRGRHTRDRGRRRRRKTIPGTDIAAILVTPEPPDARTDPLDEFTSSNKASDPSQTTAEGSRPVERILYDPEPPEARLGSGTQRGGKCGLYYKLHGTFRTTTVFSQSLEPPEARAGSRGEGSEESGTIPL
ncbi:hypothetical protein GGG16DRAFT_106826 [Schizophyllum commune]